MATITNREKALVSLLESRSIRDAAKDAGLAESTLYRYLADPRFLEEYRAARRHLMETAIGRMQAIANEAVDALQRNLCCGQASVETRTAQILLDVSIKGIETLDILDRIAYLEDVNRAGKS